MTSLRRHDRLGSSAVLVATIVLLGQASTLLHEAATPHVTCLEHGELVHLNPSSVHLLANTPRVGVLAIDAAPSESTEHAHEHCSLQGPQSPTTSTDAREVLAAPTMARATPAAPDFRATPWLLRFAPKTSPPRTPIV